METVTTRVPRLTTLRPASLSGGGAVVRRFKSSVGVTHQVIEFES